MTDSPRPLSPILKEILPFEREWLKSDPKRVESILNSMSVEEQARCALLFNGKDRQDLLILSTRAHEVVQALPEVELYQMVKELGEGDALPVLGVASSQQLEYLFDIEWWSGDKYQPERAWHWLELLDKASDQHLINWFQTEDFEQVIMVMQSFLTVMTHDEDTIVSPELEKLPHFTPDGAFHIFFKLVESEPVLKRALIQLYNEDQHLFRKIMHATVSFSVIQNVETAYQNRLMRTSSHGIPDLEEALGVYSMLDPEALKAEPPRAEEFSGKNDGIIPTFPLADTDPSTFFGQCLAMLKQPDRFEAICWELVYLANKVAVADQKESHDLSARRQTLRKTLGYINIGLELGAGGDITKGERLLSRTWLQSLFQVGHAGIQRVKWDAQKMIRENGELAEWILGPVEWDHLLSLVQAFPKIGVLSQPAEDAETPEVHWRDLETLADLNVLNQFVEKVQFKLRFFKMGLGATPESIKASASRALFPERKEDLDAVTLLSTALARYALFGKISLEPLSESAAKSFLEIIFLPGIFKDEGRVVNTDITEPFKEKILETGMAWTETDRERFVSLLEQCLEQIKIQFGRLNPKQAIEWKFTRGLWIE